MRLGAPIEAYLPRQILPETSFCMRLAMSTSRRQACSRNDIIAIHVAIARQRDFDLALAVGRFRFGLFQRVRLRQRFVDLAGDRRFARRQFALELFIVGLSRPISASSAARSSGTA